jgi:hypothetical protein
VKLLRSRRIAGAMSLAVAGVATGAVIARADAAPAPSAHASAGGVQLTPATVEKTAKRGTIGAITIKNTTTDILNVQVRVRPWNQNRQTGAVAPNLNATSTKYVRATTQSFTLKPGSRTVSLTEVRTPPGGSLYGGIEVFAKPRNAKARNGIIPQYRVVGRLRLNAAKAKPNARFGRGGLVGGGKNRQVFIDVRNLGNTLDPVGGSVKITGPSGKSGNVSPIAVVPSQVVWLKGPNVSGMKKGTYTATWTLSQGSRHYTEKTTFKL